MAEGNSQATEVRATDAKPASRKGLGRTLGLALIVLVIVAAMAAAAYGLVAHPHVTATLRDISIIALAATSIVIGLFLVVLVFQLQSLIGLLRDEIRPILESANQTVSTVRGTTSFLSDTVVTPVITAASYASALRQTVRVLAGGGRKHGPKPASAGAPGTDEPTEPAFDA